MEAGTVNTAIGLRQQDQRPPAMLPHQHDAALAAKYQSVPGAPRPRRMTFAHSNTVTDPGNYAKQTKEIRDAVLGSMRKPQTLSRHMTVDSSYYGRQGDTSGLKSPHGIDSLTMRQHRSQQPHMPRRQSSNVGATIEPLASNSQRRWSIPSRPVLPDIGKK